MTLHEKIKAELAGVEKDIANENHSGMRAELAAQKRTLEMLLNHKEEKPKKKPCLCKDSTTIAYANKSKSGKISGAGTLSDCNAGAGPDRVGVVKLVAGGGSFR